MNLLERRKQEIVWYLKSTIAVDEAEAMAGAGYRAVPCGGCGRRECPHCDADPREQVRTRGGRSDHDPRHVRVLVQRLGAFDQRLIANVEPALKALPPNERLAIMLEYGAGMKLDHVATVLRTTRQTVAKWREEGLASMVGVVWPSTTADLAVVSS